LSDNSGWEYIIDDRNKPEEKKIEELIKVIIQKDPDVIEGFDLYNSLFPSLLRRCRKYNIPLKIGRDEFQVKYLERISSYEYGFESSKFIIPGRHLVDVQDLVQSFENIKRSIEVISLESIVKSLDFTKENRITLREIEHASAENKNNFIKQYLTDNCEEMRKITESLLPVLFCFTQMIPYNLNRVIKLNNYNKLESLLIREYLKQRHSLPFPLKMEPSRGSASEIYYTGVIGPIVHIGLDMLYALALMKEGISPESDTLGVFKKTLEKMFEQYKELSSREEQEQDEINKKSIAIPEITNKILIDSFYGYISSPWSLFNSPEKSKEIVNIVKDVLDKIAKSIKNSGGIPVEVDPEEIYFVPPRDIVGEEAEKNYVTNLNKRLSDIVVISYKDRYRRMLSYKKKNHAFLGYNNKIKVKGSSLIAKSLERFGRRFIYQCIDFLLNNRIEEVHQLYNKFYKDIAEQKLDIIELQKTETLRETLREYEESVKREERNRSPYYQLALASGRKFKSGDTISFYIMNDEAAAKRSKIDYETVELVKSISQEPESGIIEKPGEGIQQQKEKQNPYLGCENYKLVDEWNPNFRDENLPYYLKRLDEIAEKFSILFTPEDFKMIFSPDDLFIYSSSNIKILTREVSTEEREEEVF
jgi:DNA polymerase elongation subunit (family B)